MIKILIFIYLLTILSYAQGSGIASNPNPPDSTIDVFWFYQNLSWTNPSNVTGLRLFIGIHPQYMTELYNGVIISNFQVPSPLEVRKTYYWRVDEIDSSGITEGNIWSFTTKNTLEPVFIDSFSSGLSNWKITNYTDSCNWKIINIDSTYYDLPPTAQTNAICLDNQYCAVGRSINKMELVNSPNLLGYTRCGIGWDNDLFLNNPSDTAYVEISGDGGLSWVRVWERIGRSHRKSQESIFLGFRSSWEFRIRFISCFEGTHDWWVIDNFFISATDLAYFPQVPPNNLTYNANINDSLNILLNWQAGIGPPSEDRYRIQRKLGDSLDQYAYFTIGETDLNTFSFLDNTVNDNTKYSYVVSICEGPLQGINSCPITVISIPLSVELTFFSVTTNGTNVLINWITGTETNNFGFKVYRKNSTSTSQTLPKWEMIGFIKGYGTTSEPHTYTFIDNNLTAGKYLYKLEQIDFDGTINHLNEVEIVIEINEKLFELYSNYPNPFNSQTIIEFVAGKDSYTKLVVYNSLGELIQKLFEGSVQVGKHYKVTFDASKLSSGIYYCTITQGERKKINKMILLK